MTTNPLRITIVTGPWFPVPPGPAGAVERVWFDLGRVFASRGHSVQVLSRAWPGLPGDSLLDGVRVIRCAAWKQTASAPLNIAKDAAYSARMLRKVPPADIVVTNAFWLPVLLKALRPDAGRVVMNIQRVPKGQLWLYRRVERMSAVSRAIADAIVSEAPAAKPRVRVIPNPIDIACFQPPAERDFTNTSGRGRSLVFTGRIHPEKGLHVLIEAFRRIHPEFPDLRLRLVGPWRVEMGGGGSEYMAQLTSLAAGLPVDIQDAVYERPKLASLLADATYYCYPTLAEHGEAQPVAPMEAMACGLAPIVSDIPQFRDYLSDGDEGVTFKLTPENVVMSMSEALRRVIGDPSFARSAGERACRKAQQFSYELVAERYLQDFMDLLRS